MLAGMNKCNYTQFHGLGPSVTSVASDLNHTQGSVPTVDHTSRLDGLRTVPGHKIVNSAGSVALSFKPFQEIIE